VFTHAQDVGAENLVVPKIHLIWVTLAEPGPQMHTANMLDKRCQRQALLVVKKQGKVLSLAAHQVIC
jgi:hypothetical protein